MVELTNVSSIFLLLFVLFYNKFANSTVIGEPRIKCSQNGITVMMEHDKPFKGALYLRGSADRKSCKADFAKSPTTNISFEFQFDDCPSRRKRQIVPPRGMTMSSVLVISYHGTIITHKDVAYQIDCFYREEHSHVQALLNVSAPQPQVLSDVPQLPVCDYRVEMAGGASPGAVSASLAGTSQVTVGQSVVHIWTCSKEAPNDVYCMHVHSCKANDGDNREVEVVDSNGCSADGELLSPIRYNGGSMRAAASSQAFKFADNQIVYFKCAIRLTVKDATENCPINNCAANNGTVISRKSRSLRNPFTVFNRRSDDMEINLLVTSPELIVEPQVPHNHLMSTYKPNYSYKRDHYAQKNGGRGLSVFPISALFLYVILL